MIKKKSVLGVFTSVFVLTLIVLVNSQLSRADWNSFVTCELNNNCSVAVFTANSSNVLQFLNDSSCFITVYNDDNFGSILISNASMVKPNASFGLHNYTISFNDTGHYPTYIQCNGSDVDDVTDFSFEVVNSSMILGNVTANCNVDDTQLAGALMILGSAILLVYLGLNIEIMAIKIFLIASGLLTAIVGLNFARIISVEAGSSSVLVNQLLYSYKIYIFMFIITMAVFLLYVIVEAYNSYVKGMKGNQE